jgi:hypothetical protein
MSMLPEPTRRLKWRRAAGLWNHKVDQVRAILRHEGVTELDAQGYRKFRDAGLTRSEVHHAVQVLESEGAVDVEPSAFSLAIWWNTGGAS